MVPEEARGRCGAPQMEQDGGIPAGEGRRFRVIPTSRTPHQVCQSSTLFAHRSGVDSAHPVLVLAAFFMAKLPCASVGHITSCPIKQHGSTDCCARKDVYQAAFKSATERVAAVKLREKILVRTS